MTQSTKEYPQSVSNPKKEDGGKENIWKNPPATPFMTSRNNNSTSILPNIKQSLQMQRNKIVQEVQEVAPIKSEPREPVQQRQPMRSYQDQPQARYEQHVELDQELVHGQEYEEDTQQDIDQGTVAIDDTYVNDAGYDYQYDGPGYEETADNAAYADQPWPSTGD